MRDAITHAVVADQVSLVRIDLSEVTFLDSSGIALLLKGRRDAEERGLRYQVFGARGAALQVLELTGVWAHLAGDGTAGRPAHS